MVGVRVLLVPNANQRLLEQLHDCRDDFLARQPRSFEIGGGAPADPRQSGGKREQPAVFNLVADLAPARLVAILLPAARISPRGPRTPGGIRADPDVGPRRRDRQAPDALEHLAV